MGRSIVGECQRTATYGTTLPGWKPGTVLGCLVDCDSSSSVAMYYFVNGQSGGPAMFSGFTGGAAAGFQPFVYTTSNAPVRFIFAEEEMFYFENVQSAFPAVRGLQPNGTFNRTVAFPYPFAAYPLPAPKAALPTDLAPPAPTPAVVSKPDVKTDIKTDAKTVSGAVVPAPSNSRFVTDCVNSVSAKVTFSNDIDVASKTVSEVWLSFITDPTMNSSLQLNASMGPVSSLLPPEAMTLLSAQLRPGTLPISPSQRTRKLVKTRLDYPPLTVGRNFTLSFAWQLGEKPIDTKQRAFIASIGDWSSKATDDSVIAWRLSCTDIVNERYELEGRIGGSAVATTPFANRTLMVMPAVDSNTVEWDLRWMPTGGPLPNGWESNGAFASDADRMQSTFLKIVPGGSLAITLPSGLMGVTAPAQTATEWTVHLEVMCPLPTSTPTDSSVKTAVLQFDSANKLTTLASINYISLFGGNNCYGNVSGLRMVSNAWGLLSATYDVKRSVITYYLNGTKVSVVSAPIDPTAPNRYNLPSKLLLFTSPTEAERRGASVRYVRIASKWSDDNAVADFNKAFQLARSPTSVLHNFTVTTQIKPVPPPPDSSLATDSSSETAEVKVWFDGKECASLGLSSDDGSGVGSLVVSHPPAISIGGLNGGAIKNIGWWRQCLNADQCSTHAQLGWRPIDLDLLHDNPNEYHSLLAAGFDTPTIDLAYDALEMALRRAPPKAAATAPSTTPPASVKPLPTTQTPATPASDSKVPQQTNPLIILSSLTPPPVSSTTPALLPMTLSQRQQLCDWILQNDEWIKRTLELRQAVKNVLEYVRLSGGSTDAALDVLAANNGSLDSTLKVLMQNEKPARDRDGKDAPIRGLLATLAVSMPAAATPPTLPSLKLPVPSTFNSFTARWKLYDILSEVPTAKKSLMRIVHANPAGNITKPDYFRDAAQYMDTVRRCERRLLNLYALRATLSLLQSLRSSVSPKLSVDRIKQFCAMITKNTDIPNAVAAMIKLTLFTAVDSGVDSNADIAADNEVAEELTRTLKAIIVSEVSSVQPQPQVVPTELASSSSTKSLSSSASASSISSKHSSHHRSPKPGGDVKKTDSRAATPMTVQVVSIADLPVTSQMLAELRAQLLLSHRFVTPDGKPQSQPIPTSALSFVVYVLELFVDVIGQHYDRERSQRETRSNSATARALANACLPSTVINLCFSLLTRTPLLSFGDDSGGAVVSFVRLLTRIAAFPSTELSVRYSDDLTGILQAAYSVSGIANYGPLFSALCELQMELLRQKSRLIVTAEDDARREAARQKTEETDRKQNKPILSINFDVKGGNVPDVNTRTQFASLFGNDLTVPTVTSEDQIRIDNSKAAVCMDGVNGSFLWQSDITVDPGTGLILSCQIATSTKDAAPPATSSKFDFGAGFYFGGNDVIFTPAPSRNSRATVRVEGGGGFDRTPINTCTPMEDVFHTLEVRYAPTGVATVRVIDGSATDKKSAAAAVMWERSWVPNSPLILSNQVGKTTIGWRTWDSAVSGRRVWFKNFTIRQMSVSPTVVINSLFNRLSDFETFVAWLNAPKQNSLPEAIIRPIMDMLTPTGANAAEIAETKSDDADPAVWLQRQSNSFVRSNDIEITELMNRLEAKSTDLSDAAINQEITASAATSRLFSLASEKLEFNRLIHHRINVLRYLQSLIADILPITDLSLDDATSWITRNIRSLRGVMWRKKKITDLRFALSSTAVALTPTALSLTVPVNAVPDNRLRRSVFGQTFTTVTKMADADRARMFRIGIGARAFNVNYLAANNNADPKSVITLSASFVSEPTDVCVAVFCVG